LKLFRVKDPSLHSKMTLNHSFLIFLLSACLITSCENRGVRVDDVKSVEPNFQPVSEAAPQETSHSSEEILFYGVFFESHFNEDTVFYPNGKITLIQGDGSIQEIEIDDHGNYVVPLSLENHCEIHFEAPTYYSKFLSIDTRGIPDSIFGAGIIMPTDMSLHQNENELVADILMQNPIGKAFMNTTIGDFGWDLDYTDSLKKVIEHLEGEAPLL